MDHPGDEDLSRLLVLSDGCPLETDEGSVTKVKV